MSIKWTYFRFTIYLYQLIVLPFIIAYFSFNRESFFNRRFVFAPVCRGVTSKRSSLPVKHPDIPPTNSPSYQSPPLQQQQDLEHYLKLLIEKESQDYNQQDETNMDKLG